MQKIMKNRFILIIIIAVIAIIAIVSVFKSKLKSDIVLEIYKAPADAIVFNSNRDGGDLNIYITDREGREWIQLTKNAENNLGPQWNGDKSKIIFVSDRDGGNYELYIMDADGKNQKRLTNTPEEETWPSISPDSRFALFARGPKNGIHDVWKLDILIGKEVNLTNTPTADELESWHNLTMDKIVFTSNRSGVFNCFAMSIDGSNPVNLTNSPLAEDHCIFSSKGDKISFARADAKNPEKDWDMWVMNADGSGQKPLYTEDSSLNDCGPWSPDDRAIVFEGTGDKGEGELYIYDFNTGKVRNLTNSPSTMELHPDW